LCLKHGRMPFAYAKAIAAAYYYNGSDDPGTREVQETVQQKGIEAAIQTYSSLDPSLPLFNLVAEAFVSKNFIF
jgi:mannitol-1-phosphate 5-dehydrogenase